MGTAGGRWRTVALWAAAAVAAAAAGDWTRISTRVEVFSSGGHVELRVDDCAIEAPVAIRRLDRITISAGRSVAPPGGGGLRVDADGREVLDVDLPRRFDVPGDGPQPVADWWLDERTAYGEVASFDVAVRGPFTIEADVRGRSLREIRLRLDGDPTATVSFRRGLINNDLFIHDAAGDTVAAGSLDPRPAGDLRHALSQLLGAVAAGCGLLAVAAALGAARRRAPPATAAAGIAPGFEHAVVAGLAVAAAALSAWVARAVLGGLPHQPDAVVSLLEARWLLDGRLWWPVTRFQPWLEVPFTYVVGDRWIGHYPYGWPLLLAPALAAGVPWLAGSVLGGLQVLLVHRVGRLLVGARPAVIAAGFAAASPMARIQAASWLSHTAASCLVLLALWALLAARRARSPAGGLWIGLALGAAFGVRPLVAAAAAAACSAVLLRDLARGTAPAARIAAAAAAGGLVAAAPTLAVNAAVTGSPLAFPYTLASGTMYAASNIGFGLRHLDAILAHLGPSLLGWGWPVLPAAWAGPLALGVCAVPLLRRRPPPASVFLAGLVAIQALAHLGAHGHGLHGYGARYWFEAYPALWLLAAVGLYRLAAVAGGHRGTAAAVAAAVLVATTAVGLPARLEAYRGYNWVDRSLVDAVDRAGFRDGVLLLTDDRWIGWGQAAPFLDPPPDAPLLVLQGPPDRLGELRERTDREIRTWDGLELRPAVPRTP